MPAVRKNKIKNKWEFDYKDLTGKRKTKGGYSTKSEAEKAKEVQTEQQKAAAWMENFVRVNQSHRAKSK